jgi:hypothetical protein
MHVKTFGKLFMLGAFGLVAILAISNLGFSQDSPTSAASDTDLQLLLTTVKENKKAFVAVNMSLTQAEADAFWPIYDEYQADLKVIQERALNVIGDYAANFAALEDDKALELMDRYLLVERDRADVRRRYIQAFSDALPGRKVARFYQIENKIDALRRFELAATIPVVD